MTLDLMADVLANTDTRLATLEQHYHDLTTRLDAPQLAQALLPDLALDDQVTMLMHAERPEQWCTDAAVRCLAAAWPDARKRLLLATAARKCGVMPAMLAGLVEQWQTQASDAQDVLIPLDHGEGLKTMPLAQRQDIIPGLLPAGCTLLAGHAKGGKSLLMYHLAIAVGSGRPFLGQFPVQQGEVMFWALEDGERRCRERILHTERQFPGLTTEADHTVFYKCWDAPRLGAGFERQTARWLDAHPACRLVIIDILEKIRPLQHGAYDLYRAGYQATAPLTRLAQERNIALVVVHHTNKNPHSDPRLLVSGPMSLLGGADNAWVLKRPYGESDAELHIAGRDVPDQSFALRFEQGAWSLRGTLDQFHLSPEREEILEILYENRTAMRATTLAKLMEKNPSSMRSLLAKMLADGQVKQQKDGAYLACLIPPSARAVTPLGEGTPQPWIPARLFPDDPRLADAADVHSVHSAAGTAPHAHAREEEIPGEEGDHGEDAGSSEDSSNGGDTGSDADGGNDEDAMDTGNTGDSGNSGDTDSAVDVGNSVDTGNVMDTDDGDNTMNAGNTMDVGNAVDGVDAPPDPVLEEDPFLEPEAYPEVAPLTLEASDEESPAHASTPEQTSTAPPAERPLQEGDWIWPCLASGARTTQAPWQIVDLQVLPNGVTMIYGQTPTGRLTPWRLEHCRRVEDTP